MVLLFRTNVILDYIKCLRVNICVTLWPSLLVSDNEAIIEFSGAEMKNVGEQLETGLF